MCHGPANLYKLCASHAKGVCNHNAGGSRLTTSVETTAYYAGEDHEYCSFGVHVHYSCRCLLDVDMVLAIQTAATSCEAFLVRIIRAASVCTHDERCHLLMQRCRGRCNPSDPTEYRSNFYMFSTPSPLPLMISLFRSASQAEALADLDLLTSSKILIRLYLQYCSQKLEARCSFAADQA